MENCSYCLTYALHAASCALSFLFVSHPSAFGLTIFVLTANFGKSAKNRWSASVSTALVVTARLASWIRMHHLPVGAPNWRACIYVPPWIQVTRTGKTTVPPSKYRLRAMGTRERAGYTCPSRSTRLACVYLLATMHIHVSRVHNSILE